MRDTKEVEVELSAFVHDLFLNNEYIEWRKNLKSSTEGKWNSLVVSLDAYDAPLQEISKFGESIVSKLVFNYVKAPDYKQSKMLMVQFTVSGGRWYSLIWHCSERN